jgi:tRNA-dihydrouridine synthase 1
MSAEPVSASLSSCASPVSVLRPDEEVKCGWATPQAGVQYSSSARYRILDGYDLSKIPNPCAHVKAAPVVPLQFDTPRKPVDYQAGWRYYDSIGRPKHVCAPMVNQSELAFRVLCRRYATEVCYTPMFHAEIFGKDPKYREEAMQIPPVPAQDRPLVVQFCGHDPQLILKAAKLVEGQCDAVDLNCGCPQNIAKRGFYGAFLLEHTQLLHDIVSTLHQHLSIPVSVKIRRLKTDEDTIALVKMLQEAGAALITVHGRSRFQLKDKVGSCDFDLIRLVKQNCAVPVFANGGIANLQDVETCLAYTGVDGVMSSEALLCNPSIFAGKRVDSLTIAQEYMDIVRELEASAPTEQSMIRAHLFKMLFQHLSIHKDLRDRLSSCVPEEFLSIVDELKSRFTGLSEEEKAAQLATVPVWYERHILTPAQQAEADRKKVQQEEEQRKRELEEEDGMCEAHCLFGEE